MDPKKLTDEQKFYLLTTSKSGTWAVDENNNLINNLYKNYYEKHNPLKK